MRQRDGGGRRSHALWGLYGLVLLGVAATILAVRDARSNADLLDTRAADDAAIKVRAALEQAVGAVRGVDAIAVEGQVDPDVFEGFARGVVDESPFAALAFAQIVELDERAAFESELGVAIRDTDGAGALLPATPRDPSFVVIDAYPRNETTNAVIGFDLASDRVRARAAAAALASNTAVLSDRTSTVAGARAGFSVMHAVRDPDGRPLGVVTSGLVVEEVVRQAGVDVGSLSGFELTVDGEVLMGRSTEGATQTFDVAGRTFRVTADDRRGMSLALPLLIGFGTLALSVAVAWAASRDRRQRSRLTRLSRRNRNIAELGQRLAGTLSASAVLEQLALHAQSILDAQWSLVVRATPEAGGGWSLETVDPSRPTPRSPGPLPELLTASVVSTEQLEADHPTVDGSALVVTDGSRNVPVVHALSAPLVFSSGVCVGAVAVGWTAPLTPEQAEDRSLAATTIAELTSRAMERAVITEVVQERALNLSALARTLASAHTSDDVGRAVAAGVAPLLGAVGAELTSAPDQIDTDDPGVVLRPVKDAKGDQIDGLRVEFPAPRSMTQTEEAVMATVTDLIGQTLERTALSDQEHEVVVQFQRALLPELPTVEGVDIASSYSPAMSVVGLGGDFYDVLAIDDHRTFIVVGDITGHGAEAVAAMAELKSVIHHLLSSHTPLGLVLEQADLLLARRDVLATALIVEVDTHSDVFRFANAGHPYPVFRPAGRSATLLTDGRRPMLGLGTPSNDPTAGHRPVAAGDLLLLYTDGLIERRTQDIDACMADLVSAVGEIDEPDLGAFLGRIEAFGRDMTGRVDDDVALIAARRR